jgi:FtsP/CotA-like multicopper oxidase with cupredoxin domain
MSGTVIVRPPDGATNIGWAGGPVFDEEVLWHLQTFDSGWKDETVSGAATARHRPDVFLLNGLETADATTDPFTRIDAAVGNRVYVRLVNNGYQWSRVTLGGLPFTIVASDGRPMRETITTNAVELGPGERYDVLFTPTAPGNVLGTVAYLDDYTGRVLGTVSTAIDVTA